MSSPAPVVEFVSARRGPVGVALLALGVLFLAAGGYCFVKGFGSVVPPAADAPPDAPPVVALNPYQTEFIGGGLTGLFGAAVGVVLGGWYLARLAPLTPDAARLEARWLLLLAGGLFGLTIMFLGLWLLGAWFDVIAKWISDRDASQAWKPLSALLVFLVGAGLAFAAVQPARAEERNHAGLRRLCYGLNFGLSAVLLVVGLVVANIVVGLKLPAELDTTDEGFYSLDPLTQEFVGGLTQDVVVYSNISEERGREGADVNRLLDACRQVNPARFKVRKVTGTDKSLVLEIAEKFKGIDFAREPGIIVATGPKESQYSFLKAGDLFTTSPTDRREVFQGESKLVNELLFLADNKARPVVYFTQGNGELQLEPGAGGGAETAVRTCAELKTSLLRNYIDAKPLVIDPAAPKVPDDASLVVVADPVGPLSAPTLTALKAYMTKPEANRKPGRLFVLAGTHGQPGGGLSPTNLNELTAPYGVTLQNKVLYSEPVLLSSGELLSPEAAKIGRTTALFRERNPIALSTPGSGLYVRSPRPVDSAATPPAGVKVMPLYATEDTRITWLESDVLTNTLRAWEDLETAIERRDAAVIRAKQAARANRPVAAVATDADNAPRLVVFGFGSVFSDELTRPRAGGNPYSEVFLASVNWLRERPPAAAIASKTYGEYRPAKPIGFAAGFWLPVGGSLVVVLFLGLGIWSYRRK